MHAYNGFGEKKMEKDYCNTLFNLLYLLSVYVQNTIFDKGYNDSRPRFIKLFNKLHSDLDSMDQRKQITPKYSLALKGLQATLIKFNLD